ncbi:MAG: PQQ-binding-like beta-propeller repeat protein [Verrucomicrobia bacterium]|nr:PQQ-binding-like beta-propeller repeat protein [Verrucomicrobiota bacterium]MBI3868520.1 PQQ-binding-like beta-propeller repeat protein [Verrucomicrobiota bacterium]
MKRLSRIAASAAALYASCSLSANAGNWPGWRGPEGTGVAADARPPVEFGKEKNLRWRAELPGPGNSSPIVWGDKVYVSQSLDKEKRRVVICFDRSSGKQLWTSGVAYADNEPTQENNPYCAGTPATDGQRVYVCFGSAGVAAYDAADGKEAWRRDLGKLSHMFGNAVSPVLHGNLCIVNFGPDEKARLIALDKSTGQTVWESTPPKPEESETQQGPGGRGGFGGGGPPGGPGGGRGGFGPGMMLAPQILAQGDKDGDHKLTKDEFASLADSWFDKLDTEKAGKVTQAEFTDRLATVLPPPPDAGRTDGPPGGGGPRGGGRGGPGRFVGPGMFTVADRDKDGSLTRIELKNTFATWAADWDIDKAGHLTEEKLRDGLNTALPRPNFGGPGGGPGGRGGRGGPGGSWSTPLLVRAEGHDELIAVFPNRIVGYDPNTGKELWRSKGIGGTIYTSPLYGEGALIGMSSGMGGGAAIALKPGGTGDVSESQRLWKQDRVKSNMGSGVIHSGLLFTVSQDGIAACMDVKTGQTKWEERLKGSGSRGSVWSSLLLADGRIYIPNQAGDVFVIKAGPVFEVLATNALGESTNASLAASNGSLIVRTDKALWCFGGGAEKP